MIMYSDKDKALKSLSNRVISQMVQVYIILLITTIFLITPLSQGFSSLPLPPAGCPPTGDSFFANDVYPPPTPEVKIEVLSY